MNPAQGLLRSEKVAATVTRAGKIAAGIIVLIRLLLALPVVQPFLQHPHIP